jgi:hypothetical protein
MIRKPTLFLLAFLVILLGVTWYLARPKKVDTTLVAIPTPGKLLPGLASENMTGLDFKYNNGLAVSLTQQNQTWSVNEPVVNNLTQGNIQEILTQLLDLSILIDLGTPPPVADLGLTTPSFTVTISSDKGYVLKVGDTTPTGGGYYVQVNQDKPYIVSKTGLDRIAELFISAQNTPTPTPITPIPTQETPTPAT